MDPFVGNCEWWKPDDSSLLRNHRRRAICVYYFLSMDSIVINNFLRFTAKNKFRIKNSFRFLFKVIDWFPLWLFAAYHMNEWEREQILCKMYTSSIKDKAKNKLEFGNYFLYLQHLSEITNCFVVLSWLCMYLLLYMDSKAINRYDLNNVKVRKFIYRISLTAIRVALW
jgi:hypothetical protein